MKEKLISDKKKTIISELLNNIMKENSSYYYSPTSEIARAIHTKIKREISRMSIDDQILIKSLSVRDIEIILSIPK